MPENSPNPTPGGEPPRPPRRKRYGGKYPRQPDLRYKEQAPEQYPDIQQHVRAQGRTPVGTHVPVLLREVLECLRPAPGETVVDCTVGYGGHAVEFLKRIGPTGRLVGFDIDAAQLDRTRERLESAAAGATVILRRGNFAGLDRALLDLNIDGCDVILADLGVSSMQLDDPARGFSYKFDGPLDMRMDPRIRQTAADLLRTMPEADLAAAFAELADEPDAALIARQIIETRRASPITRTLELVDLVTGAKRLTHRQVREATAQGGLHPAALVFQTLRILVNDELAALGRLLRIAPDCLRPGGRIGIISFHSGDDRLAKRAFRDEVRAGVYAAASEEVIRASAEERAANPRSAAAKLRWAAKA